MMNRTHVLFLLLLAILNGFAQKYPLNTEGGRVIRIEKFPSRYISSRNIDIWLPDGFSKHKKYAVIYMHDGQMLFDSTQTWNHQAWEVDRVATRLQKERKIRDIIVVGIWNDPENRHANYFPQKCFESMSEDEQKYVSDQLIQAGRINGKFVPNSDLYLHFIVNELKPFIDANYPVYPDRANTYIVGSSMGGLISMYAMCEYPQVFGGAACLSTHWPGLFKLSNNPIPNYFLMYMNTHLPSPANHKIYFDCGDQTLDSLYPAIQRKVDSILISKHYNKHSWKTEYCAGENHSEKAWSRRLALPLFFLLEKKQLSKIKK